MFVYTSEKRDIYDCHEQMNTWCYYYKYYQIDYFVNQRCHVIFTDSNAWVKKGHHSQNKLNAFTRYICTPHVALCNMAILVELSLTSPVVSYGHIGDRHTPWVSGRIPYAFRQTPRGLLDARNHRQRCIPPHRW